LKSPHPASTIVSNQLNPGQFLTGQQRFLLTIPLLIIRFLWLVAYWY
jgi:hypothetical protein